jgi:hypothetical protein
MPDIDPFYLVVVIVLVLAVFGGYYLYRTALSSGKEMDRPDDGEGLKKDD